MTDHVARSVSLPQILPVVPVAVEPPAPPPAAKNDNHDASRFRLTIEALGDNRFVYKVLDRVTGEVVRQVWLFNAAGSPDGEIMVSGALTMCLRLVVNGVGHRTSGGLKP